MAPNTVPVIFMGWEIQSGVRYRGDVCVGEWEAFTQKNWSAVKLLPEQEVYFEDDVKYPFEGLQRAIVESGGRSIFSLTPNLHR
eukprot:6914647-Karenia_brevis.AAC.1